MRRNITLPSSLRRRRRQGGQSVVEFALVLPILVFLMVAIIDVARIFTTMLSVESAAREAADYGTFGSPKWADGVVRKLDGTGTESEMHYRACVASSDLPDYAGPDDACTNPAFDYELSLDKGATWVEYVEGLGCDDPTRTPPCWVRVTLRYDFTVFFPLNVEFFGVRLGLPDTMTFERSSIFPMTDLTLP